MTVLRSNGWTPSTLPEKAYRLDQLRYGLGKPNGRGLIERDVSRYAYPALIRGRPSRPAFSLLPRAPVRPCPAPSPQSSTLFVYDLSGKNAESSA